MDNGDSDRTGDNALKLGGGYVVPIGQAAGLYVTLLYNFNYDENGPYGDALEYGIGVSFGF